MLTLLLRTRLRPYRRPLLAVVVLQLIGTIASLYLPSLNARDHRPGHRRRRHRADPPARRGDAADQPRAGGLLGRGGAPRLAHRHGLRRGRACVGLPPRRRVLHAGGEPVRRTVADHAVHERRAAGADARAHLLHDAGRRADHVRRRDRDGAARGRGPVVAGRGVRAGAGGGGRDDRRPDGAAVPPDADDDRRGQPGAARAARWHPGGAGVRPRAPGDRPGSDERTRTSRRWPPARAGCRR